MRIKGFFISILLCLFSVHSQGEVQVVNSGSNAALAKVVQPSLPGPHDQNQVQAGAGTVSSLERGIILELGPDDFIPGSLFDLEGKTLRFTPDGNGYRTEVIPLEWDSDFGTVIDGFPSIQITLNNFQFPFSGTNWSTLFVNNFGSISFGEDQSAFGF